MGRNPWVIQQLVLTPTATLYHLVSWYLVRTNITGNLRAATQTTAKARPNNLLVVEVDGATAVLAGTVNGVYVSWPQPQGPTPHQNTWQRLGSCASFPVVLTHGLSYEPVSDTFLAATMGRGIYAIHGFEKVLHQARMAQVA